MIIPASQPSMWQKSDKFFSWTKKIFFFSFVFCFWLKLKDRPKKVLIKLLFEKWIIIDWQVTTVTIYVSEVNKKELRGSFGLNFIKKLDFIVQRISCNSLHLQFIHGCTPEPKKATWRRKKKKKKKKKKSCNSLYKQDGATINLLSVL